MSEKKCTNCVESGVPCTFSGSVARRRSYVDALEARLEATEQLLRKVSAQHPDSPPSSAPSPGSSHWSSDSPVVIPSSDAVTTSGSPGPGVILAALNLRSMNTPAPAPHGDDLAHVGLIEDFNELSIHQLTDAFQGKSSGAMLVKTAVRLRQSYEERDLEWSTRRMRYWTYNPIQDRVPHLGPFVFPDTDLLSALIDLYFVHQNLYRPILHRPSFERSVANGLHTRDQSFGTVVLLVCAIASRYSDDVRVRQPEPLRRGWQFFDQIPPHSDHIFQKPTIYHLQYYILATMFLEYTTPSACWTLVGIGLRLAQDVGAHRRKDGPPTVESELWKRAFWALVAADRIFCMAQGRTCTTQYEDIDADLLIECDDEFWETENPARAFVQPAGKPARATFYNCYLRLSNILAVALKMLYSLNKTKRLLSYRDQAWEEHIIAELDSALNGWVDEIPPHLRWDPNRRDDAFFDQSAFLYCSYYQVQMTIHRPFIVLGAPSTPLPSLGICTNAARSCSHIADMSRLRKNGVPVPALLSSVFTSGLILLLNVWSGKRTGLPPHLNSAITEVHKCMATVRVCEELWQTAGLCYDFLHELTTLGELPLPKEASPSPPPSSAPPNTNKRTREDDHKSQYPRTVAPSVHHPPIGNIYCPTHLASVPTDNVAPAALQFGPLPTYTADLGQLPVFLQRPSPPPNSMSSWYPTQSAAPFGQPNFAAGVPLPDNGGDNIVNSFNVDSLFAPDAGYAGASNRAVAEGGMSGDMMTMWAKAPTSFEVDDWGTYFSVMSELSQGFETPL
ncbi:fungal-specific transcription factor domain-containing protein [Mycena galopus ATCC 62051]|nr:fungal-specific transcription factor domain-containing protein [Mycena galopus ATCC 62051]